MPQHTQPRDLKVRYRYGHGGPDKDKLCTMVRKVSDREVLVRFEGEDKDRKVNRLSLRRIGW